eukprot:2132120-Amphidinium_carterae.1
MNHTIASRQGRNCHIEEVGSPQTLNLNLAPYKLLAKRCEPKLWSCMLGKSILRPCKACEVLLTTLTEQKESFPNLFLSSMPPSTSLELRGYHGKLGLFKTCLSAC